MSARRTRTQEDGSNRPAPPARPWCRRPSTAAAGVILLAVLAGTWFLVMPGGGRGRPSRGRLLERAARHDVGAADGIVRLLDSDPDDLEVVKAVVALALVADDPDASLHWLARWHAVAPDDAVPPRLALEVASRTGRFDAVQTWGARLLSGDGDPIPVLERLVTAELATGSFTEATAHARRLRQLRGDRDDVCLLLARCLQASGLDDEARDMLEPLIRRVPPDAAAAAAWASLSRERRGDEAVVTLLREAIAAAADPAAVQAARHELCRALVEAGRPDEARVVSEEWERFEAARSAVVDAYHRPGDAALRDRVAASLAATRQDGRATELLADLASAASQQRPGGSFPGAGIGASRTDGTAGDTRADPAGVVFEDVTAAAGVDFRHDGDASPHNLIHETMGSGVAWIDYDRDAHADLFCVQVTTPRSSSPGHRLYRNLGGGRFVDVT
ncbi:MAG: tetratricopeptide repeat protein, partial [Planctomycetia bacterium]